MPLITCRDIGSIGRFGNQLFLYCFAKGYAQQMDCEFQCGDWMGRQLFEGTDDPVVIRQLAQTEVENASQRPQGYFFGQKDIDIKVFAQHQCYLAVYSRDKVKRWLKVKPDYEVRREHEYSAAHLRRGDYVSDPWLRQRYCEVSERSYDRAIEQFKIPQPVFKVTEGWRPHEAAFNGCPWFDDFLFLRDATHLLRGNSSFSVWASWLGNGTTYAPVVGSKAGLHDVEFVEGNWPCTAGQFSNQSDLHLKDK